jgi:stage V sporulation protein SpoVS
MSTTVDTDAEIFRIKSTSNVNTTAVAMFHSIKKGRPIEMQAVGAGAVNQLFKIAVHASGLVAREGRQLLLRPGMRNVMGTVQEKAQEISVVTARLVLD